MISESHRLGSIKRSSAQQISGHSAHLCVMTARGFNLRRLPVHQRAAHNRGFVQPVVISILGRHINAFVESG